MQTNDDAIVKEKDKVPAKNDELLILLGDVLEDALGMNISIM